jgi:hypothetical protein
VGGRQHGAARREGHPCRELDPDMEVEVLDVNEEARTLLLSIDPLAALAQAQEQLRDWLLKLVPAASDDLWAAWEQAALRCLESPPRPDRPGSTHVPEQYLIVVTCRDEPHQVALLGRFQAQGLQCRALLSYGAPRPRRRTASAACSTSSRSPAGRPPAACAAAGPRPGGCSP